MALSARIPDFEDRRRQIKCPYACLVPEGGKQRFQNTTLSTYIHSSNKEPHLYNGKAQKCIFCYPRLEKGETLVQIQPARPT